MYTRAKWYKSSWTKKGGGDLADKLWSISKIEEREFDHIAWYFTSVKYASPVHDLVLFYTHARQRISLYICTAIYVHLMDKNLIIIKILLSTNDCYAVLVSYLVVF